MNEVKFTHEEMEALKKVAPDHNTTSGYGTSRTYTITGGGTIQVPQTNVDSVCGNRLPCGVCLLTNKECPLFVETKGITIGDPPYPYSPFTWCVSTQDTNTSGYKKDGVETKAYNED